ncbi:MAG TPA: autotransporter-associated beta strand repeat-containing protein, partial [Gemmataceae bacterium]
MTGFVASWALLSLPLPAAAQYTWIGGSGPAWNNAANWTPPGGFPNSATATATFSGQHPGQVLIGLSQVTQSITFNNPTSNYTINSLGGQTLGGVTSITVDGAVTGVQTIDLAHVAGGSLLSPNDTNLTITNNSTAPGTTLVIGPNTVINTPGAGGLFVAGAGTTQISGSVLNGGLVQTGPGTLVLSNTGNTYNGGTYVNGGTLALGASGAVIPAGSFVLAQGGATFDIGPYGNGVANALGGITLAGATLKATGATNSDFYTKQLTMTGGTIDFTNTPFTWIHVTGAGGITSNASATTAIWNGANSGQSVIRNDSGSPMGITVAAGSTPSGIDLDAGIALSIAGQNSTFVKAGAGTMRLTNLNNTANITVGQGALRVDDMVTNGVGALGTGTITMNGGTLMYGGPSATTTKNMALTYNSYMQVLTPGVNLNYNGTITESGTSGLAVLGPGPGGSSSTLTRLTNNDYSGYTGVWGNAILAIPTIFNIGQPSPIGSDSAGHGVTLGATDSRGTLMLTGTAATYATNHPVFLDGTYPNGGAIDVQNAGTTLVWNGRFIGGGALIKSGAGTLTLTDATSDFLTRTGGTYVEGGTLVVGNAGAVIPANSDVAVSSNATLQLAYSNSGAPIGTLTLNGGTLRGPTTPATVGFYLNKLVTGSAGGTVDFSASSSSLFYFSGAGAGATINGNTNWNGRNINVTGGTTPVFSIAPNATLTINAQLVSGPYRITGGGTFYATAAPNGYYAPIVVTQARVRVDDLSVVNGYQTVLGVPGNLTLDGGTLQYSGPTQTTPFPIIVGAGGATVEVSNPSTALTLAGTIGLVSGSVA